MIKKELNNKKKLRIMQLLAALYIKSNIDIIVSESMFLELPDE